MAMTFQDAVKRFGMPLPVAAVYACNRATRAEYERMRKAAELRERRRYAEEAAALRRGEWADEWAGGGGRRG